jgi:hypothetical protein
MVSIDVPQSRADVYDFLDVMANHEPFTNHMLRDWTFDGSPSGVGSKARMTAVMPGRTDTVDMEVVEAERPVRTVERSISAKGKRVTTGTYILAELPDGGTRVTFTLAWSQAPLGDQLFAPLTRAVVRRGNERSMQRLAGQLGTRS